MTIRILDDGGPAFPDDGQANYTGGMSLRDYFAAHATEEDIRSVMVFGEGFKDPCDRATARYRHADAMLAVRKS